MKKNIYLRLSGMFFMQLFILGSTIPIISLYLKDYLGFNGLQSGLIVGMSAFAGIASPLVGSLIADRLIKAERLYALAHLTSGLIMFLLAGQTLFLPFFIIYSIYTLISVPTTALANTIVLHNLPQAGGHYGKIRLWGTIGWVACGWLFSYLYLKGGDPNALPGAGRLHNILYFSAFSSLGLGIYAFFLPASAVKTGQLNSWLPNEALAVFKRKEVVVLIGAGLLFMFNHRFYYFGASIFLKQRGFTEAQILPVMSIGQLPEIIAMFFLGLALFRFGVKKVMLFALLMDCFRFLFFSFGFNKAVIMSGFIFHGPAYTFFIGAAYIALDKRSALRSRAGVQQLFAMLCMGVGGFLGNLAAGWCADLFKYGPEKLIDFKMFWLVPLAVAILIMVMFGILFKEKEEPLPPRVA